MKKILVIAAGIILAFIILAAGCAAIVGGAMEVESNDAPTYSDPFETEEPSKKAEPEPTEEPTEEAPAMSQEEANAIESAQSYLSFAGFSREGLIEQLKFEGYSYKASVFAVDVLGVDWKEQAVKSAESYLDSGAFSKQGLIEQLEFEGYTHDQARYGVEQAY